MSAKQNYLFIDNETLGTNDNGVILSVGALVVTEENFNKPLKELKEENSFEWKLNVKSQVALGRSISKVVVDWWKTQGEDAKRVLHPSNDDVEPEDFIDGLVSWLVDQGYENDPNDWRCGAILQRGTIDFDMIASLVQQTKGSEDWLDPHMHWHKVRCIRSQIDLINLALYESVNKYSAPCNKAVVEYTDGEYRNWWNYLDHLISEHGLIRHDAKSDCLAQFESLRCMGIID